MIVSSVTRAFLVSASCETPATVCADPSKSPASMSVRMTAEMPPASASSSIYRSPAGARRHRLGVCMLISFIVSMESCSLEKPSSLASAKRCRTELEEAPIAISTRSAFLIAAGVRMSRGRTLFSSSFMTAAPVSFASTSRAERTAGMVPLPGSAMPSASNRQFMEFAVNMPEHDPHEGQAAHSKRVSSSSSILPAVYAPTASNMEERESFFPSLWPASMGPPETNAAGRLTRTAPISMPGMILSQFPTKTSASKACAFAKISALSAMISREGRE